MGTTPPGGLESPPRSEGPWPRDLEEEVAEGEWSLEWSDGGSASRRPQAPRVPSWFFFHNKKIPGTKFEA